jgi:hypothetical protein
MKHTITICLLLAFISAFANTDTTGTAVLKPKPQHQVFVNTTFFLKQIINLSNQNIVISPYIVGYKCFFTKNHGIRLSVGGNFSRKTEFLDTSSVRISRNYAFDYRVGYEFRYAFGKKWYLQTGVDFAGRYAFTGAKNNTTFDIVTTNTTTNVVGGGPFLGIQFQINNRIALFTETAFYYSYSWNKRKVNSDNFPEQNINRKGDSEMKGEFILPTSLFFVFQF